MGDIFNTLLVYPITNLLVAIYHMLFFLHIPSALGFSIILLTIVMRIILYPLIHSQLKTSRKMQTLTPHLSRIKEKHKGDAKRLQAETMRLYKEHGVNPAAGCLPMIIQLPIIWSLYTVLQHIVSLESNSVVTQINKIVYFPALRLSSPWDQHFFGISLILSPAKLISTVGFFILLVPLLTGVFQLIQSKMMFSKPKDEKTHSDKNGKKNDDFASAFQTQSMYLFPFMIGFFSYTLPIGLSLYWNTFTIFGILQQYHVQGLGGMSEWIQKPLSIWKQKKKK